MYIKKEESGIRNQELVADARINNLRKSARSAGEKESIVKSNMAYNNTFTLNAVNQHDSNTKFEKCTQNSANVHPGVTLNTINISR